MKALPLIVLTMAAGAREGVDTRQAVDWVAQYGATLNARDASRLATLFETDFPVVVHLVQRGEAPLQFTLSRNEYLQQARALWGFASHYRSDLSKPVFAPSAADGSREMTFTLKEQYTLFGTTARQVSALRVRLLPSGGAPRIAGIDATIEQQFDAP